MLKSNLFINTFIKMGEEELIDEDIDALEFFTCSMFGYSKLTSTNEARYIYMLRASANQKKQQRH